MDCLQNPPLPVSGIEKWCANAAAEASNKAKTRQKKKFDQLSARHQSSTLDPKRVVKNISSRTLTQDEERVLALGLNFAVAPKRVPYREIIAATESTARQLDANGAKQLRICISEALHKARAPRSNLDKGMCKAIKDLKQDTEIVIVPADKGSATVVMDRSEYVTKMNAMLKDDTYRQLRRDQTRRVETKVSKALRSLESNNSLSDKERKYLSPNCSKRPQIYGLPKVHKDGTPLRPIVSAIGSPTYQLAKELARILTLLAGGTETQVKNSTEFVRQIKEMEPQEGEMMISFDVVSLFTKVLIQEAIQAIHFCLTQDKSLEDRTTITVPDICRLTEMCLRSMYYNSQDIFFEQVEGVAMGSPLSLIVANLCMEELENKALETATLRPRM